MDAIKDNNNLIEEFMFEVKQLANQLLTSNSDLNAHKNLQGDEAYRTLVENSYDLICEISTDCRTQYVSPSYKSLLGYEEDELLGKSIFEIVHPDDIPNVIRKGLELIKTLKSNKITARLKHKNGQWYWFEGISKMYYTPTGEIRALHIARNVTDRKANEDNLKKRIKYEKMLSDISMKTVNCTEISSFCKQCLTIIGKTLDVSKTYIFEHYQDTDTMNNTYVWVNKGEITQKASLKRIPVNVIPQWVSTLQKGEIINYTNIEDMHEGPEKRLLSGMDVKSILAFPLFVNEKFFGFIGLSECRQRRAWLEEDINILNTVAKIVSTMFKQNVTKEMLDKTNTQLTNILESITEAFCSIDDNWRITYANKETEHLFAASKDQLIGKSLWDALPETLSLRFYKQFNKAFSEKVSVVFEDFNQQYNKWYEVRAYPSDYGLGVYFNDITERKRSEERIKHIAYHDPLTNIPNRTLFKDRLEREIVRAKRNNQMLGVMFLDLDKFKEINDTLGHDVGDRMLQSVAKRLDGCLREGDTVARIGGDEFLLLLPEVDHKANITMVSDRIINSLKQPFNFNGHEFYITTSIGITICPEDGDEAEILLKNADTAMYYAKEKGRNNYQFYRPTMNINDSVKLMKESSLRHALQRKEFILHYQPLLNVNTGQFIGVEAVVRWKHPDLGLLSPSEFISLAESTGLIVPIGEWILRTACAQCRIWQDSLLQDLCVSVNISYRQFYQQDMVETISNILNQTGLHPKYLQIEITENFAQQNPELIQTMLQKLKNLGVGISLDDFGTGYSSLTQLKQLPVDTLKIDRSFIKDINKNTNDEAIIKTVISMAQNMNLQVVAEGVETKEQLEFLKNGCCEQMQGYLFSKPVPPDQLEKLLQQSKNIFKAEKLYNNLKTTKSNVVDFLKI